MSTEDNPQSKDFCDILKGSTILTESQEFAITTYYDSLGNISTQSLPIFYDISLEMWKVIIMEYTHYFKENV